MASTSGTKETDDEPPSSSSSSSSVKDLIDHVFSWSIQDILNDDLYTHKVETIPNRFNSVQHYLGSYTMPLLEETRMEIRSQMEFMSVAPHAEVISLEESKLHGCSFLYHIKVDSWRNPYVAYGNEMYTPKPSDLFILGDIVPAVASDLQRFGSSWALASVIEDVKESDSVAAKGRVTYFHVKTSKPIKIEMKEGMKKPIFAVFLVNLATNTRTWKALHMTRNLNVIKEVLCTNSMVKENCSLCSAQADRIWAGRFDSQLSLDLNESQRAAVSRTISAVQCNHRNSVKLVLSPPGTGKTKTIGIFLYSLLCMNYRILACAPGNIAVAELALRVLILQKDVYKKSDLGRNKSGCSLGDVLLFGNVNKLELSDELKKISVDYRVDNLVECFAPLTGWKKHFDSMVEFLEDCVSQYHLLLRNEIITEVHVTEKIGTNSEVYMPLPKFAKDRFRALAVPLKRSIRILCTHLPKRLILPDNFGKMDTVCALLESFEILLSQSQVADKEFEELFARQEKLHKIIIESLEVLRSVGHSLGDRLPSSTDRRILTEFCLKNSSLIFSTVSGSYDLHEVEIGPLDLLVINEVAQLKECESVIPMQLEAIRHAVLIGDVCYPQARVKSRVSYEAGFGRSLFERMSLFGQNQMKQDYYVGSTIRDKIIPHAVSWFTGEAVQNEDFDDIDMDDEDGDEDEDEEDACSTRLPLVLAFNKTDVAQHEFASETKHDEIEAKFFEERAIHEAKYQKMYEQILNLMDGETTISFTTIIAVINESGLRFMADGLAFASSDVYSKEKKNFQASDRKAEKIYDIKNTLVAYTGSSKWAGLILKILFDKIVNEFWTPELCAAETKRLQNEYEFTPEELKEFGVDNAEDARKTTCGLIFGSFITIDERRVPSLYYADESECIEVFDTAIFEGTFADLTADKRMFCCISRGSGQHFAKDVLDEYWMFKDEKGRLGKSFKSLNSGLYTEKEHDYVLLRAMEGAVNNDECTGGDITSRRISNKYPDSIIKCKTVPEDKLTETIKELREFVHPELLKCEKKKKKKMTTMESFDFFLIICIIFMSIYLLKVLKKRFFAESS